MSQGQIDQPDAERVAVRDCVIQRRDHVARVSRAGLIEHLIADEPHLRCRAAEAIRREAAVATDQARHVGAMTVIVVRRHRLETAGSSEIEERHDALALDVLRRLDPGVDDGDDNFLAGERSAPLCQGPSFLNPMDVRSVTPSV